VLPTVHWRLRPLLLLLLLLAVLLLLWAQQALLALRLAWV
jgi:hypothetical protein